MKYSIKQHENKWLVVNMQTGLAISRDKTESGAKCVLERANENSYYETLLSITNQRPIKLNQGLIASGLRLN